ncbi:hypothetical protein ROHU_018385 [Labeo rohita]|uniref:Uncharacterized protein n=1 Tax=Labeo rohita TaxID=84645 RepID=A0A498N558_LABRO|nr:hypothetical protein ROHU_018385 [Labeo rohita]
MSTNLLQSRLISFDQAKNSLEFLHREHTCTNEAMEIVFAKRLRNQNMIISRNVENQDNRESGKLFSEVSFGRCGDVAPLNNGSTDEQKRSQHAER